MAAKATCHHLLFPADMWRYSLRSNELRVAFTISISREDHDALNRWIDTTIGVIPPIPPQELVQVCKLLEKRPGSVKSAPIKTRIASLITAIRLVADSSSNHTIKTGMDITWRNLQLQVDYLDSLGLLTPPQVKSTQVASRVVITPTPTILPLTEQRLERLNSSHKKQLKHARASRKHHPHPKRCLQSLYCESESVSEAVSSLGS